MAMWRRVVIRLAAAAVGLAPLSGASAAAAQPTPVELLAAFSDARGAYLRHGATSDRVVVGVRRIAGGVRAELAAAAQAGAAGVTGGVGVLRERAERRADLVVHIEPAAQPVPGAEGDQRRSSVRVALEMRELRAVFDRGVMTAVHAGNAAAYFRAEYDEPLGVDDVARLLPPVPLPQLDLVLSPEDGLPGSLTPYASGIVWESAVVDDLNAPTRVVSVGRTGGGTVVLVTAPQSGRVIEFACDMGPADEEGQQAVLSVRVQPAPAAGAAVWEVNVEGRERVGSLRELALRPGEVRAGQFVAGVPLVTAEGRAWTIAEGFSAGGDEGVRGPERLALVMMREGVAEGSSAKERVRGALETLAALSERAGREGTWGVRWRAVIAADAGVGSVAERVAAAATAWGVDGASALWGTSMGGTIERFARGADAAVVVIGQDRRLVGVVRLDDDEAVDVEGDVGRLVWPGAMDAALVEPAAPAQENGPEGESGPR